MTRLSALLPCALLLHACASSPEGLSGQPDAPPAATGDGPRGADAPIVIGRGDGGTGGGLIFDPCVASPKTGYDPVAAGLTACCAGNPAHCVPSSEIIPRLVDYLEACPGGQSVCMPDPIIRAGGQYQLVSCTFSITSTAGACLSKCIPIVAQNPLAGLLTKDSCGDGELCIPCANPLDQTRTGACDLIEMLCPASENPDAGAAPDAGATCPHTGPPVIDPNSLAQCSPTCGGAHCVPSTLIPPAQQSLLKACTATGGASGLCAPDELIAAGGNFKPKPCASVAGAEGRCLSTCLPEVAGKAALLPRDVCSTDERCVPCFDPTSDDPTHATGACSTACDMPLEQPVILTCPWNGPPVVNPAIFPACGSCGGMHCVPADMIPPDQRGLLAPCTGGFCAPDPIISTDDNWVPKSCVSVAGAEGRCLPGCLPPIAAKADFLPQSTCAAGQKCAPCFDPTSSDPTEATGACSIACDKPAKPPVVLTCPWTGPAVIDPKVLPPCEPACDGSHCLPAQFVPEDRRGLLAACPGGFCTPDPLIQSDDNWIPPTCSSVAGVEGRCLTTCLPSIGGQPLLPRSTCGLSEKCAPCFDPTSSDFTQPTGACGLGCDVPANPPTQITCPWLGPAVIDPSILPPCAPACAGAHCLPAQFVPTAEQALLAPCPGGFCAPDPIIQTGGEGLLPFCNAFLGTSIPGRCLSTCLPLVASQGSLEGGGCASTDRCVPCADPFSGADTGACEIACDVAPQPPATFARCCFDNGVSSARCVPKTQIPDSQEGNLKQDACPSSAYLCVPTENLPGGSGGQACSLIFGTVDGSCFSNCLDIGIGEVFPQEQCPDNHSCIPCFLAPDGSPGC